MYHIFLIVCLVFRFCNFKDVLFFLSSNPVIKTTPKRWWNNETIHQVLRQPLIKRTYLKSIQVLLSKNHDAGWVVSWRFEDLSVAILWATPCTISRQSSRVGDSIIIRNVSVCHQLQESCISSCPVPTLARCSPPCHLASTSCPTDQLLHHISAL